MVIPPRVLIVAGEASADHHGAALVRELKLMRPDVECFGVGGALMREQGFDFVARAEDMAVAGLTEVIWALPRLMGIAHDLTRAAADRVPDVAVLIDHPDFNLRLARRLKGLGIRVVYYISPQVWAWRQSRVFTIRRLVDEMLVILPFEQEFYAKHGVKAQFVGHPFVEELPLDPSRSDAREALHLGPGGPVVALLPGSRSKEVESNLPTMLQAMRVLREKIPSARALIPVASTIDRATIENAVRDAGVEAKIIDGRSTEVLSAADAAVVCSGTATLQTALLKRPMVVVYRVSWLTYQILKRMIKVAHIAIVNLIAGRTLVAELIQDEFTPENVASHVFELLEDDAARVILENELAALRARLGTGDSARRVASIVATYLPQRLP
ncbi:MAG: lipid-A-disaccharide synthase, partial [Clostridia bacterium]|nr:lipid-A-disaccharide synthase [Deltaproteobacteria bacterium]